jgi:type II secretory pathway pseudopilin PulG
MKHLKNSSGLSLLEIIIAMSVMMIGSLALVSMSESSTKQVKQLSEKLAVLDVQKLLITTMSNGSACTLALTQPVSATFDARKLKDANPPVISVNKIHASGATNSAVLIAVDQPINEYDKNIIVRSIKFVDIKDTGSGNTFNTNLSIGLSTKDANRPLKPIVVSLQINTDPTSPANAKKVISCGGSGLSSAGLKYYGMAGEYTFTVPAGVSKVLVEGHGGGGGGGGGYTGNGCSTWGSPGMDGQDSLFDDVIVGGGGKGGAGANKYTRYVPPNASGGAAGPTIFNYEGYSFPGFAGSVGRPGKGGASPSGGSGSGDFPGSGGDSGGYGYLEQGNSGGGGGGGASLSAFSVEPGESIRIRVGRGGSGGMAGCGSVSGLKGADGRVIVRW